MLYEKMIYLADISYIINTFIREYDLSKANINVLYTKGILDDKTYRWLFEAERMVRQVYVGKLQRDNPMVTKVLQEGVKEAKKNLFMYNELEDYNILSIKNDAVFVISKELRYTKFGDYIEFKEKNLYTAFYKIKTSRALFEFYYYYNSVTKEERLDIKGLSDKLIALHEDGFLQILKDIFYSLQTSNINNTMRMMKDIYYQYVNLLLPVNCYRRFNDLSDFKLKVKTITGSPFSMNYVTDDMKHMLDISYNLEILISIQKILFNIYFTR